MNCKFGPYRINDRVEERVLVIDRMDAEDELEDFLDRLFTEGFDASPEPDYVVFEQCPVKLLARLRDRHHFNIDTSPLRRNAWRSIPQGVLPF